MKLTYIIIAHHQFPLFRRIIERLDQPDVSFVFHISQNCEKGFFEQVWAAYGAAPNVVFAKRENIYWGDFSIVRSMLNGIDALQHSGFDYDYAISLSGQDYPLASHERICQTLAAGNGQQFLEWFNPETMEDDDYRRYLTTHVWIRKLHLWYPHTDRDSWTIKLYNKFFGLFLPQQRTLPNGYQGYKGSFWWQLTPECIDYIYDYLRSPEGKRLQRYYTFTYHSAEFFFQTMLMNSAFKDQVINDDNHYAVWSPETGHPKTFGEEDVEKIIASGKLFGRKFDLQNGTVVFDRIDAAVDNK